MLNFVPGLFPMVWTRASFLHNAPVVPPAFTGMGTLSPASSALTDFFKSRSASQFLLHLVQVPFALFRKGDYRGACRDCQRVQRLAQKPETWFFGSLGLLF